VDFTFVGGGLLLLIFGGNAIVRGAVTLAGRLGLSTLFLGLVVVAVGTSTPELAVSVDAVFGGQTGIAVGNIVGSNITNILLILGLGAMISPIAAEKNVVLRDGGMVLLATLMLTWLGRMGGSIERSMGVLMIAVLLLYLTFSYFSERVRPTASGDRAYEQAEKSRMHIPSIFLDIVVILAGFVAIKYGADFLIKGAVATATTLDVDETVIGLTLVAFGTSLPELTLIIIASLKRHTELAVGAIVGSNIFNILAVLGVTSILRPIKIDPMIAEVDLMIMMGSTVIMSFFLLTKCRLSRFEGLLLVAAYFAYLYLRLARLGGGFNG
jgi:cation:H+ antiporter